MSSLTSTAVPLRYARENVMFGPGEEVASLFRIPGVTYDMLPDTEKHAHAKRLARFAILAQADFSIYRVMRRYPAEDYVEQALGMADPRSDREAYRAYLAGHEQHLDLLDTHDPEVYFSIAQRGVKPRRLTSQMERIGDRAIRSVNEAFGVGDPAPIPGKEIDELLEGRQHALGRIRSAGFPDARSTTTRDLQWLARRAATRHVAEPLMDPWWRPNALVLPDGGSVSYQPRGEFERLFDAELRREDDHVVVLSQRADGKVVKTYQAFLVVGAMPDDPWFPGPEAELMYAPLEQLDFPVDSVLHANWIANKQALAEVRKAMRAHKIAFEEAETGGVELDDRQLMLRDLGREAVADLTSSEHPPSVEVSLGFAIGTTSLTELRRRLNATREVYTGVTLHHPTAIQEALYYEHLPRTGGRVVHRYREMMNARVLGGLMPTATRHVGSHRGIYHAYTVAAGLPASPVKIDVTAAAQDNLPTSWYMGGRMGSGKALADDTPMLTVDGWKTMGTLTAGDRVYDERSAPCNVLGVYPQPPGRECFEVVVSDGSPLVADADHLWRTSSWSDADKAYTWGTWTTAEIRDAPYVHALPGGRRIVAIRPVPSVPVTCIEVDSPSHLYLAGRGRIATHNTSSAQQIAAGAAMRGSIVVTVDPKPDHNICALPMLAGRTRVVNLEADEHYRGELDPLVCSPAGLREDVTVSYLLEVLPESSSKGDWESEISDAVHDVLDSNESPGLLTVLEQLRNGNETAQEAARRLTSFSQGGLGILAFSDGSRTAGDLADVTTYRMSGIELPDASLDRDDYERSDRLAVATFKLFTAKIMGLVTRDRKQHKVVILDEAWTWLGTQRGRAMLNKLVRLGRTFNVTVIICSQTISELGPLSDLIGMRVIFGVETVAEAKRGLEMVGADKDDPDLVAMLTDKDVFRAGRALLRDLSGRVADVQFDPVDPEILAVLDTSPNAQYPLAV